jgi:tetratricopeptide (TPR) repeat protein
MMEELETLLSRGELLQATRAAERQLLEQELTSSQRGRLYRLLGRLRAEYGELYGAVKFYELAWPLLMSAKDWDYLGMVRAELGIAWVEIGEIAGAVECFQAYLLDLKYYDRAKAHRGFVHYNMALAFCRQRRFNEAIAQYQEALEWFAERGFTDLTADTHQNLAWLLCHTGDLIRAAGELELAETFSRRMPPTFTTQQLLGRAHLLMLQRKIGTALTLVEEILNPRRRHSTPRQRGYAAWIAGSIAIMCGQKALASYYADLSADHSVEAKDVDVMSKANSLRRLMVEKFGSLGEEVG